MRTRKLKHIEQFLRAEVRMTKKLFRSTWGGYCSLSHFVLENGIRMEGPDPKLPKGIKKGRMGRCYENAGKIALNLTSRDEAQTDYIYCEGYAFAYFPVLHGWLLSPDGTVIDPTWQGERDLHTHEY